MWSDTLLAAEQRHLARLVLWGIGSLVAGIIVLMLSRKRPSPLLTHFGLQMSAWGGAVALLAVARSRSVDLRDLSSATRFDRMLWLSTGLEVGAAATGIAIAVTAWWAGRRLGGVGAGLAVAAHGLALAFLDLQMLAAISR